MPAAFPLIDAGAIQRFVGTRAYDRARPYAKRGAVTRLSWDADQRTLAGTVTGTESYPYECTVYLDPAPDGTFRPDEAMCTCPVGSSCKHSAAVMLSSNTLHVEGTLESAATHTTARDGSGLHGGPTRGAAGGATPPAASWRTALAPLVTAANTGGYADSASALATRLGLQFELREQVRRPRDRWHRTASSSVKATPRSTGPLVLGIRPVMPGAKEGRWILGDLSWSTLQYRVSRLDLNDGQVDWFRNIYALSRMDALGASMFGSDRVLLDDFASPLLWQLLDAAHSVGIPLVGATPDTEIRVAPLSVTLAARQTAAGGIQLAPTAHAGETELDPHALSPISNHGMYHVVWQPHPVITLGPLARPLDQRQRRLITAGPIEVPAEEADEFLADYYPVLARSMPVQADDEALALPEIALPVLVLTARYGAKTQLTLEWGWEYRAGTHLSRRALYPEYDEVGARDATAERDTLGAADRALADVLLHEDCALEADRIAPSPAPVTLHGIDAAEFTTRALPALEALEQVRVDVIGTRPDYRELTAEPTLTVSTVETDQPDWFDLGVVVHVDGIEVPFQPLFAAIAQGQRKLLLVDHSYLRLDRPVFDKLRDLIAEAQQLAEWETGELKISRYQAGLWAEFEDLADRSEQAVAWRDAVGGLLGLADDDAPAAANPVPLPAGVDATLRPYQHDGFQWLAFLWQHGLGGVLADDMGLGKTLQTLALVAHACAVELKAEAQCAVELRAEAQCASAATPAPSELRSRGSSAATPAPSELRSRGSSAATPAPSELRPRGSSAATPAPSELRPRGSSAATPVPGELPSRGSTAQAERSRTPFLVVAPSSVVSNWAAEAARFTPGLNVTAITRTGAKRGTPLAQQIAGANLVITSYTLFRLDFDEYQELPWAGLILDEAQFVKNHTARTHICARDLQASFKLAVTGTPMENNLMELWSMFDIVAPGLYPSARAFKEDYVKPIAAAGSPTQATPPEHGAKLLARLKRRIRPLMLRRTKEAVAPELPAKQEQVLAVELAPRHRKLYDTFLQRERQKLLGLLADMDRNRFIVFRSLTLLRMLSLDASLIDDAYANVPSAKLDALFEQLEDVLAEGHRTLIFSQFTSFLRKAADRLEAAGVPYAYLDGSTRRRAEVIKKFKSGTAPVFLISLKAGGFGLNLTEADYVFLLDPWWNPASEDQAIDRTHRIGQTKNVMVYRLVATKTIEEKVMALKAQKSKLFDAVLDDDATFSGTLTADDVRALLD